MKLTLQEMLDKLDDDSLLSLKEKLLHYKKEGLLFFHGPIHNKEWDSPIEIYYSLTPGTIRYRNAFPVPVSHWWKLINHKNPWELLGKYYLSYYQTKKISKKWRGTIYMFKGERYVWFYLLN